MSNPSKQKGTGGETELLRILEGLFEREFRRTSHGEPWDIEPVHYATDQGPIRVLAIRPDRGRWLLMLPPEDYVKDPFTQHMRVEVKRFARSAVHSIWEKKHGGRDEKA